MPNHWEPTAQVFVELGIGELCAFVGMRMIIFSLRGVRTGVLDIGYRGTVRGPRAVVLGWIYVALALVPLFN